MSRKTRKLIWAAPLLAVAAAIGALALFMTLTPNEAAAQATTTPMDYQAGSPLELMVAPDPTAKRSALVLTWKAPTKGSTLPVAGYRIDQSADGQRWTKLMDVGSDTMTYTHSGLAPATQKYYRVLAMNRAGIGRVSEAKSASTADIGSPSEVQNFTVTAAGPSSIKLDWDPPADNGGARIIGYLVHFSTAESATAIPSRGTDDVDGSSDRIVPVLAPTTEWTHKGLSGEETRHYKVYAVNWYDAKMTSKKTSDPVDIRSATTDPVGPPAAPTGLTAVPIVERYTSEQANNFASNAKVKAGDVRLDNDANFDGVVSSTEKSSPSAAYEPAADIHLYWYFPTDTGGDPIDRFRIEVSKTGEWPGGSVATSGDAAASIITLMGQPNENPPVAPADYAIMSVTRDGAFGADNVFQFNHAGAGPVLKSAGTLYYRVFAENGTSTQLERRSLPSPSQELDRDAQTTVTLAMTLATKPAPEPVGVVDWVTEVTAKSSDHHHDSVNLSWVKPSDGKAPTAYRVDVAKGTAAPVKWAALEPDTKHSDPTYDHRGWRPENTPQTYRYRIFAKDGGLIGQGSSIQNNTPENNDPIHVVDGETAPSPVRSLVSTTVSANETILTWEAPLNDGGTDIIRYCVLSTASTGASLASTGCTAAVPNNVTLNNIEAPKVGVLTESAPATMFSHKGLMASTTYRYRVYAVNDAVAPVDTVAEPDQPALVVDTLDASPTSEEDPTKTLSSTKPGAPTDLSVESATDSNFTTTSARGVLVVWNGPADPAGAKVSGYEVQRKVNDGEFKLLQQTSNRTTYYTDRSQPKANEVRMYRVRARNSQGWGPWTDGMTYPLPDQPNTAPTTVGAIPAMSLTVGQPTPSMMVDVSAYFNDTDTDDTLTYTVVSSMPAYATADIPTGTNMLTVTSVAPGASTITVTATDSADETATQTFTVTVTAGTLSAPTGVAAMLSGTDPGMRDVTVTWTDGMNAAQHGVALVRPDLTYEDDWIHRGQTDGMTTYMNVPSGTYLVIVAAISDDYGDMEFAEAEVTVP